MFYCDKGILSFNKWNQFDAQLSPILDSVLLGHELGLSQCVNYIHIDVQPFTNLNRNAIHFLTIVNNARGHTDGNHKIKREF
jgi:hypothetical protein